MDNEISVETINSIEVRLNTEYGPIRAMVEPDSDHVMMVKEGNIIAIPKEVWEHFTSAVSKHINDQKLRP